jgi:glycosyltransferase involved in cell wall biosynthesis
MDISVVVLAFNEEENIQACLKALLGQTYASGQWEICVVDGMSTDRTRTLVSQLQKSSSRIRLLNNEKRQIAAGRNVGLEKSSYPFVAFTDADCIAPEDWVARLKEAYENLHGRMPNVAAVGGGNQAVPGSKHFLEALGLYLDSFLGCFHSSQGRNFKDTRSVASLPCLNVLYNKELLLAAGGFDESLGNIGEDLDMNLRLRKRGYTLYFVPGIAVLHKLRPDLLNWLKHMFSYGQGRALVSFKHQLFVSGFFILPQVFMISMLCTPFGFLDPVFLLPLMYFPVLGCYVVMRAAWHRKVRLSRHLFVIFVATHFAYAMGLFKKSFQILSLAVAKKVMGRSRS